MIKWIKRLLNKYNKRASVSEDWKSLYAKSPTCTETVTANIIINAAELKYRPDGYIADTLAALIAKELVRRELIDIEQPDAEAPDRRAFVGKIEVVLRG
jgi:hypothetical protein